MKLFLYILQKSCDTLHESKGDDINQTSDRPGQSPLLFLKKNGRETKSKSKAKGFCCCKWDFYAWGQYFPQPDFSGSEKGQFFALFLSRDHRSASFPPASLCPHHCTTMLIHLESQWLSETATSDVKSYIHLSFSFRKNLSFYI